MRTRHIIQALFLSLFFAACARPVETRHGTSLPTDVSPELSAIDSSLPTGTYTLRVAMEDGQVFSDKVVKE